MRYGELRLAVDCGSVTTVAVLAWEGGWLPLQWEGWPWLSSAAHVRSDGRVTTGQAAWLAAESAPEGFVPAPVRRAGEDRLVLSGVEMPVAELVAATLRQAVGEATRVAGGPVEDVRLVVPAGWGPRRATWLRQAARRAGLADVTLVPAPVAVAQHLLAGGVRLPVGSYLAVCDLGGGVEVSVLRRGPTGFEILSTLADEQAGGSRVDELLVAQLDGHRPDPSAGAGGWQVVAAVRAAKETASVHPTVTVGSPPVVWTAGQVQAVARPVLERAAQLVVEAVAAADLGPERLAGVFLAGGGAAMPLAARVVGEAVDREPVVVADPAVAAVRGAAQAAGPGTGGVDPPPAVGPPLPPLKRAGALAVPGLASLLLLAAFLAVKDRAEGPYDWYELYLGRDYRGRDLWTASPHWGVLALAATLMVVACLSAATMIASVLPVAAGPRAPAGSDASQLAGGLLAAAGLGATVAGVYAVGPSLFFGAPVEPFLRWTLLPIAPLLATVVAVAALVARWGRRPAQGWHSWLGFPVISTIPTAVGMLLVDLTSAYYGDFTLPNLVQRFGGLLIGVGIALAVVQPWLWRLVLAGPVGVVTAALTDFRTIGVLAVVYILAVTLWWLQRAWQLWQRPPQRWLPGT